MTAGAGCRSTVHFSTSFSTTRNSFRTKRDFTLLPIEPLLAPPFFDDFGESAVRNDWGTSVVSERVLSGVEREKWPVKLQCGSVVTVIDEAQRSESTHEEADSRPRCTHHLRQS